jgi:rSAM/selenodomain-associated transferase 1
MKNQETCILLFVKYPKKGEVKHRLSKTLPQEITVELYRNFVLDTLATLKKLHTPVFICCYPPDTFQKIQDWLGTTYHYIPQEGKDLGQRMKHCFEYAFEQGYRRVVLMGTDSPDLPVEFLSNALSLRTHDVVLGPAVDGGYYLIGFQNTTFVAEAFEGISWSTPAVFEDTLEKIKNASRTISLLPVWSDIDTGDDLRKMIQRTKNTAFKSSHTISYIRQNKLMTEDDHVTMSEM